MSVESPADNFLTNPFNRMEILMEEMNSRIQLVAEGLAMNNERLDRLTSKKDLLPMRRDITKLNKVVFA